MAQFDHYCYGPPSLTDGKRWWIDTSQKATVNTLLFLSFQGDVYFYREDTWRKLVGGVDFILSQPDYFTEITNQIRNYEGRDFLKMVYPLITNNKLVEDW